MASPVCSTATVCQLALWVLALLVVAPPCGAATPHSHPPPIPRPPPPNPFLTGETWEEWGKGPRGKDQRPIFSSFKVGAALAALLIASLFPVAACLGVSGTSDMGVVTVSIQEDSNPSGLQPRDMAQRLPAPTGPPAPLQLLAALHAPAGDAAKLPVHSLLAWLHVRQRKSAG
jgi:hypothetical protein